MKTQTTPAPAINAGGGGAAHGGARRTEEIKARIEAMFADDRPDQQREAR